MRAQKVTKAVTTAGTYRIDGRFDTGYSIFHGIAIMDESDKLGAGDVVNSFRHKGREILPDDVEFALLKSKSANQAANDRVATKMMSPVKIDGESFDFTFTTTGTSFTFTMYLFLFENEEEYKRWLSL